MSRLAALVNGWRGEADRIEGNCLAGVSETGDMLVKQRAATLRECAGELEVEVAVGVAEGTSTAAATAELMWELLSQVIAPSHGLPEELTARIRTTMALYERVR